MLAARPSVTTPRRRLLGTKAGAQRCYFNSDSPLQPHPAWRHRRDIDHRLPCWWSSRLDRTQAPAVRPPHCVSSGERVALLLRQPVHLSAASHQRLQLQQLVPGSCRRRQRQLHRHHSSPCRAIQTTLIPGVVKDCALHRNLHSSRGNLGAPVYTRFSTPDLLWSPYVIGHTIIFSSCGFFLLLSFFPRLISAVGDWMYAILPHMVWP